LRTPDLLWDGAMRCRRTRRSSSSPTASATGFEVRDEAGAAMPESVDSDDGWRSQTAHVRRAA
jgi:hypothetical protein